VRVRLEPYCDIGLLSKPDPMRYGYAFTPAGLAWTEALTGVESDAQVADSPALRAGASGLATRFFATAAHAWVLNARPVADPQTIVPYLHRAWQAIQSAGGYAPIEEMALVAGIEALLGENLIIEPGVAREALIAHQKANPYQVRFTVNRMGLLAHARFMEAPTGE